jgi:hypothetical protein
MILSFRSKARKIAACAFSAATFSLIFPVLLAISSGGPPSTRERPRFGIFMPKLDVYSGTPDVQQRVEAYLRRATNPADIELAEFPIISEDDLDSYDWDTHTLHLRDSIWLKIPRPRRSVGTPFVLVVDGTPIYVGAFWSRLSSFACPGPVIVSEYFGHDERDSIHLAIRLGYGPPDEGFPDPRNSEQLKKVLAELGKLRTK